MLDPMKRPPVYRGGPRGISHETRRTWGGTECLALTATPCARPTVKGEAYCATHAPNRKESR